MRIACALPALLLAGGIASTGAAASVAPSFGRLPIAFERNEGQSAGGVEYLARGDGYTLFLTSHEAVFASARSCAEGASTLRMSLVGAATGAEIGGFDPLPGRANYFIGSDPARWRRDVPMYRRVRYRGVRPGVDLVFYGTGRELEYDLVLAPGADAGSLQIRIDGAKRLRVDGAGELVLDPEAGTAGTIRFRRPVAYQEGSGVRRSVVASFVLRGGNRVGFRVGAYDRSRPLVVDPVLVYSTFAGGSTEDRTAGVAVDATGSAYVVGYTTSSDFPVLIPYQGANPAGNGSAFVFKLAPAGDALVFSTYYGGSTGTAALAVAVDTAGSAYVTGDTSSPDLPLKNAFQAVRKGTGDAFVVKLTPAGNDLVYATYLGGSETENGFGIAVDASGAAYIAGETVSADFPTAAPFQLGLGGLVDAFVTKLDPSGTSLVYSTYLGGTMLDQAAAIAVDGSGNAYVVGGTNSADFPVRAALQGAYRGSEDAFVARFGPSGALVFSTFLGGSLTDFANGVAVDSTGNAYVAGDTWSVDFPTISPVQPSNVAPSSSAFIAKLKSDGSALVYSTYLGGSVGQHARGIAVDAPGDAYVAGFTFSADFPVVRSLQAGPTFDPGCGGDPDCGAVFVTKLNPAGSAFVYSTLLFGSVADFGRGIGLDPAGNAYVAGYTSSADFPTRRPLQSSLHGRKNAFVARIDDACVLPLDAVSPIAARKQAGTDVRLEWASLTSDGSDVWRALRKQDVPIARTPGAPPAVVAVAGCGPSVVPSCVDAGAVPGAGGTTFYYQVRGLCGTTEGE